MAEHQSELELQAPRLSRHFNSEQTDRAEVRMVSREKFEDDLDVALEKMDFDQIRKEITPYQLSKCKINCLEKSLEVSYRLRKRAKGPDAENFKQMGTAVEDFASHLLDPLKKNDNRRSTLERQDLDRIIDKAVAYKQMKFLSHPVMHTLLKKRWKGDFYEKNICIWLLLNLWTVCDVWLFFLVFPLLYLISIITVKCCKTGRKKWDLYEYYLEYFTTPYFIFARDTISYLVLLGLDYAMCLKRTSVDMICIEWIILVFFLGRFLMEINQAHVISKEQKPICERAKTTLLRYLRDWWKLLDVFCLFILLIIMVLRLSSNRSNRSNRTIVAIWAAYGYGIYALVLTIRVFCRIMESKKYTGPIQIALFHIISAVVVISGQFLAILLAFSFAITKAYLAGESFSNTMAHAHDRNVTSFEVWWSSFRYLSWSLLAKKEHDSVTSPHEISEIVAKVLYGIFLLIGGVLLLNMLIALLTNTYKKVEDNAFYEWSHKKAITIRTYCTYHPVPVPFNIVSLLLKFILYIYRKLPNCKKLRILQRPDSNVPLAIVSYQRFGTHVSAGYATPEITITPVNAVSAGYATPEITITPVNAESATPENTNNPVSAESETPENTNNPKEIFINLIVYLQSEYFSVHGYTFPKTDSEKINDMVKETKGCRQLMGNIASRVFEYNFEEKHGAHTYATDKWRHKGIKIDGQRIFYMDCDCHASGCGLAEYNGGVLRQPLTEDWPKFEVLIQECTELRFIAIGLVDAKWDPHDVPGSKGNSVGYCVQKKKA